MSTGEQIIRPDKGAKRSSRHVKIVRGAVTPIFGLLTAAAVVLGHMSATMRKPSTETTASATMSGSRYVTTDPNVLTLLGQNAAIAVDSGSSQDKACVALGSPEDAVGWAAPEGSYTRITGLALRSELDTQKGSSTSQGAPTNTDDVVSFKDFDMWTVVKCGTGSVSLKSKKTGALTVVTADLGKDATNAKVQSHWVHSEVPDFAMSFHLSGGLLAVLAVLCASMFVMSSHKRCKRMVEGTIDTVIKEETLVNIAVSRKPDGANRRNRRHHVTHWCLGRASSQSLQSEATGTPVIIDPSLCNLIAGQQTGAKSGAEPGLSVDDNESTSVITPDKLQAYFSCLAQEVNIGDDLADDGQEES